MHHFIQENLKGVIRFLLIFPGIIILYLYYSSGKDENQFIKYLGQSNEIKLLHIHNTGYFVLNTPDSIYAEIQKGDEKRLFDYSSSPQTIFETDVLIYTLDTWHDALTMVGADGPLSSLANELSKLEIDLPYQVRAILLADDEDASGVKTNILIFLNMSAIEGKCNNPQIAKAILNIFSSDFPTSVDALFRECMSP